MSRSTSVMGLSKKAKQWLDKHAKRQEIKICPTCGHTVNGNYIRNIYDEKTGVQAGMFDDGPLLYRYDTDIGFVIEVIQASPWSSGPCIFLCLQDANGRKICEWSEDEINNC